MPQTFDLGKKLKQHDHLTLRIIEVYPGSKYADTVVTELLVLDDARAK